MELEQKYNRIQFFRHLTITAWEHIYCVQQKFLTELQ